MEACLDVSGDALISCDQDRLVTFMNRAAEQLTGLRSAQAVGRPVTEVLKLFDPRSGEPVADPVEALGGTARRKPRESSLRLQRMDGSARYVSATSSAVRDSASGAKGWVVAVRDEARRLAAEEALRNSEQLYRTIVENSFDGIYILQGRHYLYVNPAFCSITGYSFAEVTRRTFDYNVFLDDEGRAFMEERFAARSENRPVPSQYGLRIRNKSGRPVDIEVSTISLEAGPEPRILGIMRDVSARLSVERELRESESMMRSVLSSMTDTIFRFDAEGRFLFYNSPRIELIMPPSAFMGRRYDEVLPQPIAGMIRSALKDVQRGRTVEFEYSLEMHGGIMWFSARLSPVTLSGAWSGFIALIRDITERKAQEVSRERLEEQIRRSQKLESLGLLAGGMAHDFNDLLMGILGNAELAADAGEDRSLCSTYLGQIEASARRAADLCRQLMAYSGRSRAASEPLDLSDLVRSMAELLRVNIPEGVILRFDLATGLPQVLGDPVDLQQAVLNLVSNAGGEIGAGAGTGSIVVRTGSMYCDREYLRGCYVDDSLTPGIYATLEVSDTGPGMDERTSSRIFDPFFNTRLQGRGIGLAAVLGIVRAHHGTVRVFSETGQGTTFRISLPAVSSRDDSGMTGRVAPVKGRKSVLVIDDEEIVRSVLLRMLEKLGYDAVAAASGTEGLEILSGEPGRFGHVLLDLVMPGMDGAEVFKRIRDLDPSLRILISSGYNESEISEKLGGVAPDGVILKPFRINALESVLGEGSA